MNKLFLVFAFYSLEAFSLCIQGDQISCTDVSVDTYRSLKTCRMPLCTINSTGVTIASLKDENMMKIIFEYNKKVFYLPDKIHEVYPNLEIYSAGSCSIIKISVKNFENLTKLKELNLEFNNIDTIPNDVFKSLISIEGIFLASNKIKFIDGKAFQGHRKLQTITLENNICISENWNEEQDMDSFEMSIRLKCGLSETKQKLETITER